MNRTFKLAVAAIAVTGVMAVAPAVTTAVTVAPAVADGGSNGKSNGGDRSRAAKLRVIGLADAGTKLVQFDANKPGKVRSSIGVGGLTGGDTRLIGIDYRVQDGNLYGVGNNTASAGVYLINPDTGVATQVTRLTVPLSGTTFGVDFNPAANALRVVSDSGQNLRQPFASAGAATVADGTLSYAPPAIATGVNGAAYTNNDLDPNTATTLYDLDTALDQIALQSPANAGSLAATGKLAVDATGDTGFDIYSTIRDGSTVEVMGFATINGSLYEIALFNGKATSLGTIGVPVTDLAIPLNQL
ncbi:DUF4394 domain-containing protein [Arthrobacter sp. B0490]|uniref:DUF4394 domain-containing protein n=1 Tax=Arthrobacter sp. B0490 TaxID=2058891 RepID=UPI001C6696C6|nr:DUF4394 domain-containing protein [Arthrobacter sp. B0490]